MQHGEATDAGVEDGNRQISGVASHGGNGGTADGMRPPAVRLHTDIHPAGPRSHDPVAESSHPRLEPCAARADDRLLENRTQGRPHVSPARTRSRRTRPGRRGGPRNAQPGTVEYVALILLVALVMAGVVAAMKGFRTDEGKELGDVILEKIKQAVRRVQF